MPIYQPPKQSSTGSIVTGIGGAAMSLAPLTGPAAPFVMAGGAIASVVGTLINGDNAKKSSDYETKYANSVIGENNIRSSYQNNLNQSRNNYTSQGVSSSLNAINEMINPSSNVPSNGGTGISNQRLI